jgi:hypothetical protein
MASAQEDIAALIARADTEYPTLDKGRRVDFAGVTAMAGLTILARHLDALKERLDRIDPPAGEGHIDLGPQVNELRQLVEELTARVDQGPEPAQ